MKSNYVMKIPHGAFTDTVDALKLYGENYRAWINYRANLPLVTKEADGERGLEKRCRELEEIEGRLQKASELAAKAIEKARARWDRDYEAVFTPHGADAASADLKPLEMGLVETPDELRRVLEKRPDSVLFQRAVERYAKERGWEGFSRPPVEEGAKEFAAVFFQRADIAAKNLDGYEAAALTYPGELERLAAACGLSDEWEAGADEAAAE